MDSSRKKYFLEQAKHTTANMRAPSLKQWWKLMPKCEEELFAYRF